MTDYLKTYMVKLNLVGPLFIGSGRNIGKKEYYVAGKNKVVIPDIDRLYGFLQKKGKENAFEEFLLKNNRDGLAEWLRQADVKLSELQEVSSYTLACDEKLFGRGGRIEVKGFMKDSYGQPYIPGSSLKGMLRTILLASEVLKDSSYQNMADKISENAVRELKISNRFASSDIKAIESKAFNRLGRIGTEPKDAVNDIMQGFIVSDSLPLTCDDLALCQSVDKHLDGTEKALPIAWECLKPGTEVQFSLTVDSSICKYDDKKILEAIKLFNDYCYDVFLKSFNGENRLADNIVSLGGGVGFASKTVLYQLLGENEGRRIVSIILDKQFPKHKHRDDARKGASPHVVKCARYNGKALQMGRCKLSIS